MNEFAGLKKWVIADDVKLKLNLNLQIWHLIST